MRSIIFILFAVSLSFGLACAGGKVTVKPAEIEDILVNPGIGIETFHCFNGERDVKNYPECSIAYFRFYWDVLELEKDKYNFKMIDSLLVIAAEKNQDLALRFMAMDTRPKPPKYFRDAGGGAWWDHSGAEGPRPRKGFKLYAPDFNSDLFLERQEKLVRVFGERYDGHPDIIRMDIGSIGRWGEWHTHQSRTGIPMPTEENALKVIDWYFKYWVKTPLSMLIGYSPGMRHAVAKGAGWRADSLGDWGHFNDTWSHMIDSYPDLVENGNAALAWQRGPVTFEPPGSNVHLLDYVPTKGGGWDNMWDAALQWGGSSYNGKSRDIPDEMVPSMERFLKKCGYRFVLKSLTHSKTVSAGGKLDIALEFDNIGVAPPYRDYLLGIKLAGAETELMFVYDIATTGWVPGTYGFKKSIDLPSDIPAGGCDISVALLEPTTRKPDVKLAIDGLGDDGWYRLSEVSIN
ncbi:DUF4832 domain-containing protein [candidate division KSB1 bacterium]